MDLLSTGERKIKINLIILFSLITPDYRERGVRSPKYDPNLRILFRIIKVIVSYSYIYMQEEQKTQIVFSSLQINFAIISSLVLVLYVFFLFSNIPDLYYIRLVRFLEMQWIGTGTKKEVIAISGIICTKLRM